MDLNEQLKKEINSREYQQIKDDYRKNLPKLSEVMEQMKTKKDKFVQTEFSRYNVKLTKGNIIIISELKEDEANRLFDRICQLT